MNCEFYNEPFDYILIKDTYDSNQLENIWKDLDFFHHKLREPSYTLSSFDSDTNEYRKKNVGIFLHTDNETRNSHIVNYSDIFFDSQKINCEISGILFKYYPTFNPIRCNYIKPKILLSYYDDGDYYKPHRDSSLFTLVTFLYKELKKFEGGNLFFPEYDFLLEIENNMTIIFPSVVEHEVLKITMGENISGYGRYSITSFIDYGDTQVDLSMLKVGDKIDLSKFE